jgi:hypothetical protein
VTDAGRFHAPQSYVVRTRRGFDARCYRLRADDWNAFGELLDESSHRTLAAAEKSAMRMHRRFGGELDFSHKQH